jgi:preprotein translocase subunit SecD
MKKLIIFIALSLILLVVGIVAVSVMFIKQPIPLSPSARLEVKIAEKEPADGLTPVTLEDMGVGTLYVHDKAELSTSDVAGVYMSEDQMGRPAIRVVLTKAGRERMWSMTSSNIGKEAVIFVNGQAVWAPRIQVPVSKKFVITGPNDGSIDEWFTALTQP